MKKRELWKKTEEEEETKGQNEMMDKNNDEITIHMDTAVWYPEYY
jgi:hypothetical protein